MQKLLQPSVWGGECLHWGTTQQSLASHCQHVWQEEEAAPLSHSWHPWRTDSDLGSTLPETTKSWDPHLWNTMLWLSSSTRHTFPYWPFWWRRVVRGDTVPQVQLECKLKWFVVCPTENPQPHPTRRWPPNWILPHSAPTLLQERRHKESCQLEGDSPHECELQAVEPAIVRLIAKGSRTTLKDQSKWLQAPSFLWAAHHYHQTCGRGMQDTSSLSGYHVFIDFKKTLDSLWWHQMEGILGAFRVFRIMIQAIMASYHGHQVQILTSAGLTEPISLTCGVLQGNICAPYLYVMCLDYVLRQALRKESDSYGFTYEPRQRSQHPAKTLTNTDFANDIILLSVHYWHSEDAPGQWKGSFYCWAKDQCSQNSVHHGG